MSPPPTATKVSLTPGKRTRSDKSVGTVRIMLVPLQWRFKTKIDYAANAVSWETYYCCNLRSICTWAHT